LLTIGNLLPITDRITQQLVFVPEHHAAHLRLFVLQ